MMHVMDMHPGMKILGSDGDFVGAFRSLSGQLMGVQAGPAPDEFHYLDLALVHEVGNDAIRLLVPAEEARQRWSEEE